MSGHNYNKTYREQIILMHCLDQQIETLTLTKFNANFDTLADPEPELNHGTTFEIIEQEVR